ncbi:leucine-rich repeats and immunoglobulin-like domains protein 1 isoform X8 [Marmota marmota marmota]|uniref:leucine-rich repeats and immunoglobulin-like domains protein 1 isoform X8 n=1 Tax=Marmota marmota marmota TaxID=9994 RepID=UPI002092ED04|nr:leucine-rich repeats and immunoglobulin-like domains protein 1 isoform X8 [Marmota marmota marmota]
MSSVSIPQGREHSLLGLLNRVAASTASSPEQESWGEDARRRSSLRNLSYNKLSEIHPAGFEDLPNLQEMYLHNNELTAIPSLGAASPHVVSLFLQHNRIRSVNGSQLKAYLSLEVLDLSSNNITEIRSSCFPPGLYIRELNLASNHIGTLELGAFDGLSRSLRFLHLSKNRITQLPIKAFKLPRLTQLILSFNNLTGLDEKSLAKLGSLSILHLSHNSISHIAEGAFTGLKNLRILDLGENAIRSVQLDTFIMMRNLKELHISSDSFLCDCQLKWLPPWLESTTLQAFVTATCAQPESLKGQSIFSVPPERFVCDGFPKPQIITQPETTTAVVGKDIRFTCSAASSSSSPMTFVWKKDNEVLANVNMENFSQVRKQDGEVMEYTTILHLHRVTFGHEGRYQCVITNHFGSTYSNKARLMVNETPSLVLPLEDLVVSVGETVALQCKATGSPSPHITWLKGNRPLSLTYRHHFTPGNQLLVVQNVVVEDAGQYTCEMSNMLDREHAHSQLSILPTPGCRKDGTTMGIFTIAVVCSIVLKSLVWVCITYQTRKKSKEYSVTNTGNSGIRFFSSEALSDWRMDW